MTRPHAAAIPHIFSPVCKSGGMTLRKRLTVEVTPEQHMKVKREALDLGVTVSALMEHRLLGTPLDGRPKAGRPSNHDEQDELPMSQAS